MNHKYLTGSNKGFTLIELMIVVSLIAILASIAQPMYQKAILKAKEATLKENLFKMRDLIDQYYADHGFYPDSLENLVAEKYMRIIPVDPITESDATWILIPPSTDMDYMDYMDYDQSMAEETGGVFDVRSGSPEVGTNGIPYNEW